MLNKETIMAAVAFDTLKLVENLTESGFSDIQARGVTNALKEAQDTHLEDLATKSDLAELKADLASDLAEVKAELKADINNLDNKITSLEHSLDNKITSLERSTTHNFANIKKDIIHNEERLKAEMVDLKSDMIRWMIGIAVSIVGILFILLKAML